MDTLDQIMQRMEEVSNMCQQLCDRLEAGGERKSRHNAEFQQMARIQHAIATHVWLLSGVVIAIRDGRPVPAAFDKSRSAEILSFQKKPPSGD